MQRGKCCLAMQMSGQGSWLGMAADLLEPVASIEERDGGFAARVSFTLSPVNVTVIGLCNHLYYWLPRLLPLL